MNLDVISIQNEDDVQEALLDVSKLFDKVIDAG
jgi:hypothetical protein